MTTVFIVDRNSDELATALSEIANRDRLDLKFRLHTSPETMFDAFKSGAPDLILLHHHWIGIKISDLLQKLSATLPITRVIVFTGQDLDISELIECVRFGVADYWGERANLDSQVVFRKIAHYCSSDAWTIEKLRMPSGSLFQLLQAAEASTAQRAAIGRERDALVLKIREYESRDSGEIVRAVISIVKLAFAGAILTGSFLLALRKGQVSALAAFSFVFVVGAVFLFMDGRLTQAMLKFRSGSAQLRGR